MKGRGEKGWCRRPDSNRHGYYPTRPSTVRVYQFRHFGRMRSLQKTGLRGQLARRSVIRLVGASLACGVTVSLGGFTFSGIRRRLELFGFGFHVTISCAFV